MKCPHCKNYIHINFQNEELGVDNKYYWYVRYENCPSCKKKIIFLLNTPFSGDINLKNEFLVYPKISSCDNAPNEVPSHIAEDFNEAGLILNDSPKASAALSRRCLQTIIHEHFKIKKKNLSEEIDEVMTKVPEYISKQLDAIRQIGNFSAHPIKSQNTGEIVNVETGEAEWCLDILQSLFQFCYVQPKIAEEKMVELNKKLEECGKPLLKGN
ncbi:DUF4145 domain-containing protein [Aliarcobacter skirrowii]|uniref:DUF4145 domain-containing protein n=1 Tax=Aliarcobacter skirrowii CCUG 10374 TaxID=1032239 RepID=A0AAD0SNB2_9BACT|nr:DUF4145 domain-containing protein [Aliarcobacter skirrowii]AXX85719.1 DUF4145 domain-containing protein [Aliarcobacter skirrowii CCUG 10374]KAB0619404.1 DUF4145 domain-containing protein [Aliarcobacter skirrowii CCUG 10374]RXI25110.1 hypothetical protein CP959_09135 [Aliarcobacter skirrowii CCUG 10374]SUU95745.1 Uncharacterised protein [Aliarcobacter skirrowii]